MLPPFLQYWRHVELGEGLAPSVLPASTQSEPAIGGAAEEHVRVDFLYASPLAWRAQVLDQLDVPSEVRALRGLPRLGLRVHTATATALCEALAAGSACSVLHLSAHCALWPQPVLLLEDASSAAHAVNEEELAAMGPWGREGLLLVFLACGSELLVRGLVQRCGLRRAICCAGEVFDSAARAFCRAFYHALCEGHGAADAHRLAQAAVRGSANPGLRSEADKFLLLGSGLEEEVASPCRRLGPPPTPPPRWPLWPPVEDYVPRVAEALRVASLFAHRRVLLLWGEDGLGKTAFCRELCRHFSAPGGRLFSAGAFWLDRGSLRPEGEGEAGAGAEGSTAWGEAFARAVAEELAARGAGEACPAGEGAEAAGGAWKALREAARRLDDAGSWLLVVDGLRLHEGEERQLAEALDALLYVSASLRLLLTARRPSRCKHWTGLADAKVNTLELAPLPPQLSAKLFARRVRRPLYPRDLDAAAPGPEEPGGSQPLRLQGREAAGSGAGLLERLAASPLLHALGGLPGKVVEAAALVDEALPSLLRHPALPSCWQEPAASAERTDLAAELPGV